MALFTRIVKLIVSSFVFIADRLLRLLRYSVNMVQPATCTVLYYHSIPSAARFRFAAQMNMLVRHATAVQCASHVRLQTGRHHAAVTFDDGFENVFSQAVPELIRRGIPSLVFVPPAHLGQYPKWIKGSARYVHGKLATAEDLKARDRSVVIASHTLTHKPLTGLGVEQAKAELSTSKALIEAIVDGPVTCLSFPHGLYNQDLLALADECGYNRLFGIEPRLIKDRIDSKVIGRVAVEPSDWPIEFFLKLMGAYRWMETFSRSKVLFVKALKKDRSGIKLMQADR